jgi:hypothetical protein
MRCAIAAPLVLTLLGGCVDSGSVDDVHGETTSESDEGEGEGESDGTESLLGQTCTPALGDCSPGVLCCSTDPAALDLDDLDAMILPAYQGSALAGGVPLFADANNAAGRRGVCVEDGAVPETRQLLGAAGCPRPCNPRWPDEQVQEVCGPNSRCCQDVELTIDDCVLDPGLGTAGCWRPVTGLDIVGLGGLEATEWELYEHASHQDPGLPPDGACETVIAGLPPEVDVEAFRAACRKRLTVADQRGMCLSSAGLVCPYEVPSYIDACEQLNVDAGLTGC